MSRQAACHCSWLPPPYPAAATQPWSHKATPVEPRQLRQETEGRRFFICVIAAWGCPTSGGRGMDRPSRAATHWVLASSDQPGEGRFPPSVRAQPSNEDVLSSLVGEWSALEVRHWCRICKQGVTMHACPCSVCVGTVGALSVHGLQPCVCVYAWGGGGRLQGPPAPPSYQGGLFS